MYKKAGTSGQYVLTEDIRVKLYGREEEVSCERGDIFVVKKITSPWLSDSDASKVLFENIFDKTVTIEIDEKLRCSFCKRKQLKLAKWYFGELTHQEVGRIMRDYGTGSYLVRSSSSRMDRLVLELKVSEKFIASYYIIEKENSYFITPRVCFPSITKLIDKNHGTVVTLDRIPCRNEIAKRNFIDEFSRKHWVLNQWDVKIIKEIDDGNFGTVYYGKFKTYNVAVKIMKNEAKNIDSFLSEAAFLTMLRHPNIIFIVGILTMNDRMHVLTEYCDNGNLHNYLGTVTSRTANFQLLLKVCRDTCSALQYLSHLKFVHRDVSARNVLLTADFTGKLIDFGLTTVEKLINTASIDLPVRWSAPEMLEYKLASESSDVWSFGVMLWEVFSLGRIPYPKWDNDVILKRLKNGDRMVPPENAPKSVVKIMKDCWKLPPNERPTFLLLSDEIDEILASRLCESINKEVILKPS